VDAAAAYGDGWFEERLAPALESPRRIAPLVADLMRPQSIRSVIDVGCGPGTWLEAFTGLGAEDILGIDGEWLDRDVLRFPADRLLIHDLEQPLQLDRTFDLAISLEVAEHVSPDAAPHLVDALTRAAPVVLFSAAAPLQGGTHHVNERWPQAWAGLFAERGFVTVDPVRPRIWTDEQIAWYYRQNIIVCVRRDALDRYPALREEHERTHGAILPLVHPERYLRVAKASPVRLKDAVLEAAYERWPALQQAARAVRSVAAR
jgi:SAM-dependent methyltransferase